MYVKNTPNLGSQEHKLNKEYIQESEFPAQFSDEEEMQQVFLLVSRFYLSPNHKLLDVANTELAVYHSQT